MATKPSGSPGRSLPGGNPMNLTCTTVAPVTDADGPPQMVKIVIHSNGKVSSPEGWDPYLPPEALAVYKIHDDDTGEEWDIEGSGVAIFTKNLD